VQAQKMEAVGRLAGSVAHDFNNLLSVIIGFAELLQRRPDTEPDTVAAYTEQIGVAGHHGAALVRRMLAFSRQPEAEQQPIELGVLLREMEPMVRSIIGEAVELRIDVPPNLGLIRADPLQLEQVLLNLATNARDAMPNGDRSNSSPARARRPERCRPAPACV
jgi:signal transduction histidine kinase